MIPLWDGWAIDADEYQFVLGVPSERLRGQENRVSKEMTNATYHPSLGKALAAFARMKLRDYAHQNDASLAEAIREYAAIEQRIREIAGKETGE